MTQDQARLLLQERLQAVRERMASACARAGRAVEEVTLVAVTKTVNVETAALLAELGVVDLGENRPQELWRKAGILQQPLRWHMIGHMQRNKIARTLPLVAWVHSVDSVRLLEALDKEAGKLGKPVRVLLEVNTSGEASKSGFAPGEMAGLTAAIQKLRWVHVRGLMTMAALQDPQDCRPGFIRLRELSGQIQASVQAPHALDQLSMGMSNDFEVAIEEGATLVRLGTVLFEGLDAK